MLVYALFALLLAWHPGFTADTALNILGGTLATLTLLSAVRAPRPQVATIVMYGALALVLLTTAYSNHGAQWTLNAVLILLGMPFAILLAMGLGEAAGRRAGPAPSMWPVYRLPEIERDVS